MNQDLATIIRQKVDIVDIIGERIPLVMKGKNYFGVCPFHDDTNPSMCVSREKQIYTCFSCHATGNVYTFLMNYDHIDFKQALKILGDRVGVSTGNIKINTKSTKYDKLYEAYQLAIKYFQNNLSSSGGKEARNYLKSRGITEDIIKEFEIGLSLPSRDDLTKLLTTKGYSLADLNRIGLSSDDHDVYDDRITFPLYEVSGKPVGISGRIYKDNGQNKYLNTKETPIFKKGEMLYNYHRAIEECRREKSVIVMEGFMDVIRAYTIGVKNVVALMGTALTEEQINLLKRLSSNIIMCLDGDDPGVHATLSIGDTLLEQKIEVKVIPLPKEDDPDTYILKNGKEKFERLIKAAVNFSDFKISKLKNNINFNSDVEKANYINTVLLETTKINDDIRVEIVLKKLAKEFDIGYNTLEKRFNDLKSQNEEKKETIIVPKKENQKKTRYEKAVEQIIYFMLNNDWVISQVDKEKIVFPSEESRMLSSEIIYYYKMHGDINVADFYTYVQDKDGILALLNSILADADALLDTTTKEDLFDYFKCLNDYRRKLEIKRLTGLMKKEIDPIEQSKIAENIRKLRMGE